MPEARISTAIGQDSSKTTKAKNLRVPESADLIKNPSGSALGLKIRTERGIIYVLPRKIDELRFMLKNSVVPELKSPSS
jgi:molybdopterin-biosynthesis enzyme MoeA-like protein